MTTDPSVPTRPPSWLDVEPSTSLRKAAWERFAKLVDPNNELAPEERERRAECLRKAHFVRMGKASAAARKRSRSKAGGK